MTWTGKNEVVHEPLARDEMEAMLKDVDASYAIRHVPKGAMVIWPGEADDNHYYVAEGSVECFRLDRDGRKKVIDRYGEGMFFGYHILRDDCMPMSTMRCEEDSRLVVIPKESFFKLLHGSPKFADRCVRYLFGVLSMQTNEMLNQSFYDTGQRVPMLLSGLVSERLSEGAFDERGVLIPLGNNEIADMLGVSRNSVTSVVSRLQAQGIVEKQRNALRVIDPERLADIARREQE
ncbi:Crp/Fnr family transcriptional regulator [Adlercreutzia sp. R25]|uniref:Crp/Fnr family transcriptional regulator n=1 Tax=Adlercreutzia shanghongiae TaxID=3111773 RepID=UPI002DBF3390|nr:Crp/Fnr family transcriptional regulator [Adlercreutzia sp. R25]MEC4271640.1 Crp/Fnr family transcriptional regulator [Adlercreutzia sp. R25]